MEEKNASGRQVITIAVVGPESSGKSVLCEMLALHFKTVYVKEIARDYLTALDRNYTLSDIEEISRLQLLEEEEQKKKASGILLCDTNLIVSKIWAEFVFGNCPSWIDSVVRSRHYDHYLLTAPDVPWVPDPLREHPHQRNELFALYESLLNQLEIKYTVVTGLGSLRFENALKGLGIVL